MKLNILIRFINCVPLFSQNMMTVFITCLTNQNGFLSKRLGSGRFYGWISWVNDMLTIID